MGLAPLLSSAKMQDNRLTELLTSPRLSLYFDEIKRVLADEQARREHFYEITTEFDKAEFVNGEVVIHLPAKKRHTDVSRRLLLLLSAFVQKFGLGFVGHEKVLITLSRNDYEPDICFFRQEIAQGFSPEQSKFPPPDFIVEILSPSTESVDRTTKLLDYAIHGVTEYWIVDPEKETVEQYLLNDDVYELNLKSTTGEVSSVAVSDWTIPVRAIFDDQTHWNTVAKLFQDN